MNALDDSPLMRDDTLFILAYDHGMEHGPADLREAPDLDPERIFDLAGHDAVTALAVGKGLAEQYAHDHEDVPLLVKLNGSTSLTTNAHYSALTCTVERAVELGADAVGYTVYPGSDREGEMFETFRHVQETARQYGIPVVAWSYPRGGAVEDDTSPDIISYAARIALELGADAAKVKYPGSGEAAAEAAAMAGNVPVTLSGGAKSGDRDFLETVHEVMANGFQGLAVGRNVWQRTDADAYLDALQAVVHEGKPVDDAMARLG